MEHSVSNKTVYILLLTCLLLNGYGITVDSGKVLTSKAGCPRMTGRGRTMGRLLREIANLERRNTELENQCSGKMERPEDETRKMSVDSRNPQTDGRYVNISSIGRVLSKANNCFCNNMNGNNDTISRMLREVTELRDRYQRLERKYQNETKQFQNRYKDLERIFNETKSRWYKDGTCVSGMEGSKRRVSIVDCNHETVKDCRWYKVCNPTVQSGPQVISINANTTFAADCDMETEDGGWTIIFSRSDEITFSGKKTWKEYKEGFRSGNANFWIGNDKIHRLTEGRPSEMLFKFIDRWGAMYWASYTNVTVADENDFYRLHFDRNSYNGTAGDALYYGGSLWENAHNMAFSTWDNDNDMWDDGNCAHSSGLWYNDCGGVWLTKLNHEWASPHERPREIQTSVVMIRAMSEWYTV